MKADTRTTLACVLIGVSAVALAGIRILGDRSSAFQAVAHLFVGGLFGAWLEGGRSARPLLWTALLLSVVELACFPIGIGGNH